MQRIILTRSAPRYKPPSQYEFRECFRKPNSNNFVVVPPSQFVQFCATLPTTQFTNLFTFSNESKRRPLLLGPKPEPPNRRYYSTFEDPKENNAPPVNANANTTSTTSNMCAPHSQQEKGTDPRKVLSLTNQIILPDQVGAAANLATTQTIVETSKEKAADSTISPQSSCEKQPTENELNKNSTSTNQDNKTNANSSQENRENNNDSNSRSSNNSNNNNESNQQNNHNNNESSKKKTFYRKLRDGDINLKNLIHVSNIITAIAFTVPDVLWLRLLLVLSGICGLIVNYAVIKPRFWAAIKWGLFFMALNLFQIVRILLDRKDVVLDKEQQELYDAVFSGVYTKPEFRRLLRYAKYKTFEKGTELMTEGEEINQVYAIVSGVCRAEEENKEADSDHTVLMERLKQLNNSNHNRDNNSGNSDSSLAGIEKRVLAYLKRGQLVGEIALVTGSSTEAPITVTVEETVACYVWTKVDLQKLFFQHPSLAGGWNAIVSNDLLRRFKEMKNLSVTNQYQLFLYGILNHGVVHKNDREVVDLYCKTYNIPREVHESALAAYGWTLEDWKRGSLHKGWFGKVKSHLLVPSFSNKELVSSTQQVVNGANANASPSGATSDINNQNLTHHTNLSTTNSTNGNAVPASLTPLPVVGTTPPSNPLSRPVTATAAALSPYPPPPPSPTPSPVETSLNTENRTPASAQPQQGLLTPSPVFSVASTLVPPKLELENSSQFPSVLSDDFILPSSADPKKNSNGSSSNSGENDKGKGKGTPPPVPPAQSSPPSGSSVIVSAGGNGGTTNVAVKGNGGGNKNHLLHDLEGIYHRQSLFDTLYHLSLIPF